MRPFAVAAVLAFGGRRRLGGIAVEPFADVVVVKLLAPDHAGECLALDVAGVGVGDVVLQLGVKFVGLANARGEDGIEIGKRFRRLLAFAKPQADRALNRRQES